MRITSKNVFYDFSDRVPPAVCVDAPATVILEAKDCFDNQVRSADDSMDVIGEISLNPATGPVYVNGAEPGDALKVTIDKIVLDEKGMVCCMPGDGPLGDELDQSYFRIMPVSDGRTRFETDTGMAVDLPLRPMIGVIGVAAEDGQVSSTATAGRHGGNMDNSMIGEGATIYFPVSAKGALFGLGDLHAAMGDGEVGGSGLEIPADVHVTLDVVKGKAPAWPVLETEEVISVIVSLPTVDAACEEAVRQMQRLIMERTELSLPDTAMLMSLAGDLQICQIVDPVMTVRFVMSKKAIPGLTF